MGRKSNLAKLGLPEVEGVRIQADGDQWRGFAADLNGREESRGGFASAVAAYTWAVARRAKLAEGVSAGAITLDACLAEYEAKAEDDETGGKHVGQARKLVEALVAAGIRNVKASDFGKRLKDWIKGLQTDWSYEEGECPKAVRPLANRTKRQYAGMISTVIDVARASDGSRFGMLVNPASDIEVGKVQSGDPTATFTIAELRKMVSDDFRHDKWFLLNCGLVYTGYRSTVASQIRFEWFDFEQDQIRWFNTKNKTRGTSYLQPEFKEVVLAEMARRGLKPGDEGWLIEDPDIRATGCITPRKGIRKKDPEKRTSIDSHTKAFRLMLERLKIPLFTPDKRKRKTHSTRHSFISLHAGRGNADISKIQEWVGHKTRSMTTETYGSEAEGYAHAVRNWPGYSMCLRHAPDSEFHQPKKPANPETLALHAEVAELRAELRAALAVVLDRESFVLVEDRPD